MTLVEKLRAAQQSGVSYISLDGSGSEWSATMWRRHPARETISARGSGPVEALGNVLQNRTSEVKVERSPTSLEGIL